MRILCVLSLLGTALGWAVLGTNSATAQSGAPGVAKRPLDLPAGGRGNTEEEEDEPESITFYGTQFEGDGFFWCLDKSCSMGWGGEIETLKQETTSTLQQLSRLSQFSLVSFSNNMSVWNEFPQKATLPNKSNARAWVQSMVAGGETCLSPAGVRICEIANRSSQRNIQILILGDGMPFCGGVDTSAACLSAITAANYKRHPIHTLYISASGGGISFFQSLAAMNGGTFTQVQ